MSDETKTTARREHCWHESAGVVRLSNPPLYPVQCCRCGVDGHRRDYFERLRSTEHGPYAKVSKPVFDPETECSEWVAPEPTAEVSFIPLCAICGNQLIMATEEPKDECGFWRKSFLHMAYPENCPNASRRFALPRIQVEEVK